VKSKNENFESGNLNQAKPSQPSQLLLRPTCRDRLLLRQNEKKLKLRTLVQKKSVKNW